MATGDIYQLILDAEYFDTDQKNVYHFQQTAGIGGGSAADLVDAFEAVVMPALANLQVGAMLYERIVCINGMDNSDFEEEAGLDITQGAQPVNGHPTFTTMTIRFGRNGPGTNYSYKRYSGIPMAWLETPVKWTAGGLAALSNVGAALVQPITFGGASYQYVQVSGGFRLGVPPVKNHDITSFSMIISPTTQNSRKVGYGD